MHLQVSRLYKTPCRKGLELVSCTNTLSYATVNRFRDTWKVGMMSFRVIRVGLNSAALRRAAAINYSTYLTTPSLHNHLLSKFCSTHHSTSKKLSAKPPGTKRIMGKNKKIKAIPGEEHFNLPSPPSDVKIVDTHTHLVSTFQSYRSHYPTGKYATIHEFVRGMYSAKDDGSKQVEAIVDVYCEAPPLAIWKEIADSALTEEQRRDLWGGIDYWFVMGVHPHDASKYTDEIENQIVEAMAHPRCVGWGEIGLDYHYDNSPREIQQKALERQLKQAIRLGKPLTIHTREAEEDTERILKAIVPKDYKIHIHCFTDSPEFAQRLLEHFPNLYIGITGVITYSTNLNTSATIRGMAERDSNSPLRIVLETDAPFMVPSNIYNTLPKLPGRLPLSHTGMIPWTASFAANVAGEGWDADRILREGREAAHQVYSI